MTNSQPETPSPEAMASFEPVAVVVAQAWAEAVIGTSYLPLSGPEVRAFVHELVDQLNDLLVSEAFRPESAQAIGARMVEAHFTNPLSLSRTLGVLLTAPERLTNSSDELTRRWQQVVVCLAEGYTRALRDWVLREQQEMLEAALTAREQAEEAAWASERQLQQTREDFIATVSHELRTPLTPIKGYLHLLISTGDALGTDQRVQLYRMMLSQADILQHLMDDLLTAASGVAEARFSISLQQTDVVKVVKRALEGVDPNTTRQFRWLGDDEIGTAMCDPMRLRQVVATLLRNADLYATTGEPVHVSAHRTADTVEIRVRDFGPGIPADQAEAVFEPFRRLGRGSTPGAGLGLHIARRLVEGMNGKIWETDGSPGSCFHVTLPCTST